MMRGDTTLNRPFADDADTALKRFGQISPSSGSGLTLYYLVDLREKVGAHLDTFNELATDNIGVVFEHFEFE